MSLDYSIEMDNCDKCSSTERFEVAYNEYLRRSGVTEYVGETNLLKARSYEEATVAGEYARKRTAVLCLLIEFDDYPIGICLPCLQTLRDELARAGGTTPMKVLGNNLVGSPKVLWNVPYKLWSLWDMIQYPVRDLCLWLTSLISLTDRLERHGSSSHNEKLSQLTEAALAGEIKTTLDELEKLLGQCELELSLTRLKRTQLALAGNPPVSRFSHELGTLHETISDELVPRVFMFIPGNKAKFYSSPEEQFPKSWDAFPSAREDMTDAGKCYAANQNTACVFHCMGILQQGLYALANAKEIQVSFPYPIVLADWAQIIEQIESKIVPLKNLPKGQVKDELLKFYSDAAMQFRYFKDAWRNHVAHLREQYDEHVAFSVFIHVRDFIEHLATQLSELPLPNNMQQGTPQ